MRCWRILLPMIAIQIGLLVSGCASHRIARPPLPPAQEKREKRGGVFHIVERHQTLYRICKTYRIDINEVVSLNGITDPGKIHVGQRIFIPGAKKILQVEIRIDDVATERGGEEAEKVVREKISLVWPVEGKLGDLFEKAENRRHQGIDIITPLGTPIRAAGSGVVLYSGNSIRGYGNLVILRHSEEMVSVYAHNQANLVEEGVWVDRGQTIGRVGQTGKASGPHLHFEIRINNEAVDPLPFLK